MYYDLMTAALDAADSIRLSTPAVEALRSLVGLDFRARKAKEKECALAARDYAVRVLSSCGAASSMFYFVCFCTVILRTVTFHANLAHSLTRSPYHL